jgi:hypothetical protein
MSIVIIAVIVAQAVVSAGFCMVLGDAKGYNPGRWGFAGFLFGPLALLAVAGMPVARENEAGRAEQLKSASSRDVGGATKECPACQTPNPFDAAWCVKCNKAFPRLDLR